MRLRRAVIPALLVLAGAAASAEEADNRIPGVTPVMGPPSPTATNDPPPPTSGLLAAFETAGKVINITLGVSVLAVYYGAPLVASSPVTVPIYLEKPDAKEPDTFWTMTAGWAVPATHQPQRAPEQIIGADLLMAWEHDHRGLDGDGVHRWFRAEASTRWRVGVVLTADRIDGDDHHRLLGQADLSYRFAQLHGWYFSLGAGGRWSRDEDGSAHGADCFYAIQAWPIAPLVLRGQFGVGRLGDDNVVEAWAHAGVGWRHGEVFVGERYLRIGASSLTGPLLGAGFHW